MATRIIETLGMPFDLNDREIQISASFGIGVYPEDGLDVSSLTRNTENRHVSSQRCGTEQFQILYRGHE